MEFQKRPRGPIQIPREYLQAYSDRKMTIRQIAVKLGRSTSAIYRAMVKVPGLVRPNRLSVFYIEAFKANRMTVSEIAKEVGHSKGAVYRQLARLGLKEPPRPRGPRKASITIPQQYLEAHAAGDMTIAAVAKKMGRSMSAVYKALVAKLGPVRPRRKIRPIVIPQELLESYKAAEITIQDISKKIGVSAIKVSKALVALGLDTSVYQHRMDRRNLLVWQAFQKHKQLAVVAKMFDLSKERVRQIVFRYKNKNK